MSISTDSLSVSSALAHLTRLQMLDILRFGILKFDELVRELKSSPSVVNFHLRTLVNAKLVIESESMGYGLTEFGRTTFDDFIQRAEERLKKQEENKIDTK